MNWLFWAAERLWTYYQDEKKARAIQNLRQKPKVIGMLSLEWFFLSSGLKSGQMSREMPFT